MTNKYSLECRRSNEPDPAQQRGFGALLLLVFIAGIAVSAAMFSYSRSNTLNLETDRRTADALASAKAALIGYAVRSGAVLGAGRPGELPCPDTNGDGEQDTPCLASTARLGRIPWKTLGIPEPRDSAGETLWYAVASPFRTNAVNRINSDTRGNITVRAADNSTLLTSDAVAVILAPGAATGSQNRRLSGTVLCSVPGLASGLTIAAGLCPSNYFETLGTTNNATANGPFVAGARSNTFNDQLTFLTTSELMPAVEMRVGGELKALLQAYRANSPCQCYPWADNWPYSGGIADVGQNRGRFPSVPFPHSWGAGTIPPLPLWVAANDWHNLFWYSVSRQNSDGGGANCRTCSTEPLLSVGEAKVSVVFFTPGTPVDGLARLTSFSRRNNLALYLQDAQNNDGAAAACPDTGEIGGSGGVGALTGAASCDTYVLPSATARDRDRIFTVGVAGAGVCAANAQTILSSAPCGAEGNAVKPECVAAQDSLDSCTCLSAARVMNSPPCTNVLDPPQCEAAIAQLQACII